MNRTFLASCLFICLISGQTLLLSGCAAPALLLTPQGQLMWALLKPMVGLDPKEVNFFKQPLIQSRLQPLLGNHYDSAVQLLETANKIQQEGPLFYLVSTYSPVPELAEKAGFVWNSETNQMAVLMVSGGAPQIFAEKLNEQMATQIPSWPKELADYTDPARLKQKALEQARTEAAARLSVPPEAQSLTNAVLQGDSLKEQAKTLLESQQQQVLQEALSPVQQAEQQLLQQKEQILQQQTQPLLDLKQQVKDTVTEQQSKLPQQAAAAGQQATQQLLTDAGTLSAATTATPATPLVADESAKQMQQAATAAVSTVAPHSPAASQTAESAKTASAGEKYPSPVQTVSQGLAADTNTASTSRPLTEKAVSIATEQPAVDAEFAEEEARLRQQQQARLLAELHQINQQLTQTRVIAEQTALNQRKQQIEQQLQALKVQQPQP